MMMNLHLQALTLLLCCAVCVWFYVIRTADINYQRHPQLIDSKTGAKLRPKDIFQLTKIIHHDQSYINSTNAQERLYDLEYTFNFETAFVIDQSYSSPVDLHSSGLPVANQTLCAHQLKWILTKLDANKNFTYLRGQLGFELTSLIDTFGKPLSGSYSGSFHWLGSYKRCSQLSLNNGLIKTRYCVGKMRSQSWPNNETIYPKTRIRFGLCLPESCDTQSFDFHRLPIERLAKYDLSDFYKTELELESMFCLPDERSPLRQIPTSGRLYLMIVGGWMMIVLMATLLYEYRGSNRNRNKHHDYLEEILKTLSLRCSFMDFMTDPFMTRKSESRVSLSFINCMKILMIICVVLGHSIYLNMSYTQSIANRLEVAVSLSGRMGFFFPPLMGTFFMLFGVLGSYSLLRKYSIEQLVSPAIWFEVNLSIFFRIAPVYALVYWYSRSVEPYTGAGPWWDYGVDEFTVKHACKIESPWKSLPYFGSIGSDPIPFTACILTSWFLVCYSHLSLLLPLLTYTIFKLPNHLSRFLLVTFLMTASAAHVGFRLYNQTSIPEEGFSSYGAVLFGFLENFESTGHMTTLSRLGSAAFGCLVGYLLRLYELEKIRRWPHWLTSKCTLLFVIVSLTLFTLSPALPLITSQRTSLNEFLAGDVILIFLWPLFNGVLIIGFATTYKQSTIARFCSHSFWTVFNKLGLLIYLVHWHMMVESLTSFEEAPSHGFKEDIFKTWAYILLLSIMLSLALYLFVELPISRLSLLLLKRKSLAKSSGFASPEQQLEMLQSSSRSLRV